MIKSVYKLDKRIKDVLDIQSSARYDDSFIGEVCYFADSIWEFEDLESCDKGTLSEHIEDGYCQLGNFTAKEFKGDNFFDYFIPEKLLKPIEKKYRPYNISEFVNQYDLGDEVIVRRKLNRDTNIHKLFTEYGENDNTVHLGTYWYTFQDLYDRYELYTSEGWKPFGVEVEE